MAGMARAMGATLTGAQKLFSKIKNCMYIFLNLYFAPFARDVTRLDGARDNKQV